MSDPAVWGPSMWRILHSLAERLGKQSNMLLIQDEQRAWINFIRAVEPAIPCKRCRAHFRDWMVTHRLTESANKANAREWLWGLHSEVNKERRIPNPDLYEVETMYGSRSGNDITRDTEECFKHLLTATQRTHITSDAFRTFKYRLSLLRKFTG